MLLLALLADAVGFCLVGTGGFTLGLVGIMIMMLVATAWSNHALRTRPRRI